MIKIPEAVRLAIGEHEFVAVSKIKPDVVLAVGETRQEVVAALDEKLGNPRQGCIIYPRKATSPSIVRGNPSRGLR